MSMKNTGLVLAPVNHLLGHRLGDNEVRRASGADDNVGAVDMIGEVFEWDRGALKDFGEFHRAFERPIRHQYR